MPDKKVARYGAWKSPITSDLIVAATIGLSDVSIDGDDIYWNEVRPTEGGRFVVVRRSRDGTTTDMTPASFNARTRVHEYGGAAFAVSDGEVFFSNFTDGRLFRQDGESQPRPLTAEGQLRYADIVVDRGRRLLYCVREDHTAGGEPENTLVSISLDGDPSSGRIVVSGNDFYSNPRLSPDGRRLAWICWNHPNMPWDGTELWVADLDDSGAIVSRELIA
ncbi:MAG TPA: S9 family peptidase, partial [Blastocatellia bacterium]|nr:S9 family peptidase [Blastocatellia bacterium]